MNIEKISPEASPADETFARIQEIRHERAVGQDTYDLHDVELREVQRLEYQARVEGRTEEFFVADPPRAEDLPFLQKVIGHAQRMFGTH